MLRFGEIQDVKTEPGLYFKAPLAFAGLDNVQKIENRKLTFDLDDIRVQVSGGKFYEVDAFVVYRIDDGRLFRANVLRRPAGGRTAPAHPSRFGVAQCLRQARVRGSAVGRARLDDARSSRPVAARSQFARTGDRGCAHTPHRPDQGSLGPDLRAHEGRAIGRSRIHSRPRPGRAQGNRARADRQVVEIIASAQRESEILRGEGEGERSRIFAEAFNRDPEFFEFYRSMAAYQQALEKTGTTMVLSPNSDFFRYFRDPGGVQKPAQ